MSVPDGFRRVKKDCLCPVCSRPDWCLVSVDDPPSKALCKRVASPHPWGEAGYLHRLRDDGWRSTSPVRQVRIAMSTPVDLADLAERYRQAATPHALAHHAADLGLSVQSLRRLGIGWTPRAWTFPMTGAAGITSGIRFRAPDGTKWSQRGGREGLFTPTGLDASGTLAVAEGPTDTAALLDLGLAAVGRPSCTGGTKLLAALVRSHRPNAVVIFADADEPGQHGAGRLAAVLSTYCRRVRMVTPPAKDARAWLRQGATPQAAMNLIDTAPVCRMAVRVLGRPS